MRKFLMVTVLAGAGALGLGITAPAEAAPHGFASPLAVQSQEGVQAQVEQVQYRRHQRRPHHRRYYRRGRR